MKRSKKIFRIIMLSSSKIPLTNEMNEYLKIVNDKYMEKCMKQKKRIILYEPIKRIDKRI